VRRIVAWRPVWGRAAAVAAMAIPIALSHRLLLGWFTVTLGPLVQALAAGYLVCSFVLHRQGVGYRLLNLKPVAFIGVLSYSLYIWQQPFFSPPAIFGVPSSIFLTFPFNLVSLFAVSMLSYGLLERPLTKLRFRFRARHAQDIQAANRSDAR
jgi:peptidoglycan/LPS O-acetylase OafA/YrhL